MGILSRLRGFDRRYWYVCYNCMMQTGHDTVNSVFYSEAPLVDVVGRPSMPCPRCASTNTKSFQTLKDEGSEAPLWGLERIVRKYPRSQFMVKPATAGRVPAARPETSSSVH
ncbi:MAG TPA: hypothetical protein VG860_21850 [Terriglobia bacterium]|jgi:hypothetical protein|nr:hypothetical protein [Terriglobia bacterium]